MTANPATARTHVSRCAPRRAAAVMTASALDLSCLKRCITEEWFAVIVDRRLQIFTRCCEHYVKAPRFPHIRGCCVKTPCIPTLDPAIKTCHMPQHDGAEAHLLHYYRELT